MEKITNDKLIECFNAILDKYGVPETYLSNFFDNSYDYNYDSFIDILNYNNVLDSKDNVCVSKVNKGIITYDDFIFTCHYFDNDTSCYHFKDMLVRECINTNITEIEETQKIVDDIVHKNNFKSLNITTKEPPFLRFRAKNNVWKPKCN